MPSTLSLSRRQFLRGTGVACAAILSGRVAVGDDAAPPPAFLLEWGRPGKADGEFAACIGVAVGPNDEIYTAEFKNQRVQRFTPEGKFLGGFAIEPHAGGLAVDEAGVVYVAHWNDNHLAAYSPTGERLRVWGEKGSEPGQFQLPGSVTLGPDGLLYVPDQGNSRVQRFTREGKFVSQFGSLGREPGQFGGDQTAGGRFAGPQFVAFDPAGNLYTTDPALDRISHFTPDGQLLAIWGSESAEPGGFGPPHLNKDGTPGMSGPIGVVVDRQDRVWVSATNHRVQQFAADGRYLRGVGGEGNGPGQFHLPHSLAIDSRGHLYVSDVMNSRIQKFDAA